MKKILIIILLLPIFQKTFSQYEGTFGLGAHISSLTKSVNFGSGLNFQYYYTNNIRFAPSFNIYIDKKNQTKIWDIYLDANYMVPIVDFISIYPILGAYFSSKKEGIYYDEDMYINRTRSRLGIDFGLGIQYDFMYKAIVNLDFKYNLINDYNQLFISLGIGFWI